MADRVFEDRVGLWVIEPGNLADRLPKIKAFAGGLVRDLFLPRTAPPSAFTAVRAAGLYAHLRVTPDGQTAAAFADRTLADIARLVPGAVELDVELASDPPLEPYLRGLVTRIRETRPSYRIRLNLAPWKGFALPVDLLQHDPALYVCEQTYLGNMAELLSPADVLADLTSHGAPAGKATVCYAAACQVLASPARVRTLPDLSRLHRGVIFSDDLMVEAGLL